jgi:predicted HD phosphohydrolase
MAMAVVSFVHMEDGTAEDYALLDGLERGFHERTSDRVLAYLGNPTEQLEGYQVDRLQHALQTATRAQRDGAGEEMVVAALLHDIGDELAPCNHGDFAAAILKPYVTEVTHWIVRHHGIFQAYYYAHHLGADRNARERYRGHPHFQATVDFCQRWDQASFDPAYDTLPLQAFEPMVRRLFAREPFKYDRT